MDLLIFIFMACVIIMMGVALRGLFLRGLERQRDTWATFAEQLDLTFVRDQGLTGHVGHIEGVYNGHRVRIVHVSGVVLCEVAYTVELGLGLAVSQRATLNLHLPHHIRTGDPTFEQRFIVSGKQRDAVLALLTLPVRERMVHLDRVLKKHRGMLGELTLNDERIHVNIHTNRCNMTALRTLLTAQQELATVIMQSKGHMATMQSHPESADVHVAQVP